MEKKHMNTTAMEVNMSNPHRALAEMHKFSINPADPRTLDELESYYRNLSHGSPFARACSELVAEDTAQNAQEFAELTTRAALNRARAQADETEENKKGAPQDGTGNE